MKSWGRGSNDDQCSLETQVHGFLFCFVLLSDSFLQNESDTHSHQGQVPKNSMVMELKVKKI